MYKGFNLKLNDIDIFSGIQKEIYYKEEKSRQKAIDFSSYYSRRTNGEKILDGNKIIEEWFPYRNDFHIFLSHSHKDEKLALAIAGKLRKRHHLNVFVDSVIWNNYQDLLKHIDNDFCWNSNTGNYDYNMRNLSTSHVHLMLMNSLNVMIDRCEVLIFLNTPNSISLKDSIYRPDRTLSPWIFSEIQTSKIIRKRVPKRKSIPLRESTEYFSHQGLEMVSYELGLEHLTKISPEKFKEWVYSQHSYPEESLDYLYRIMKDNKTSSFFKY